MLVGRAAIEQGPLTETAMRTIGRLPSHLLPLVAAGTALTVTAACAGVISGSTSAKLGVEVGVFEFPGFRTAESWVVAGGDAAVMMRRSPGAEALVRYLATPPAAGVWAALGGFISPNLGLDPAVYPDDVSRSMALDVVDAGDDLRFGLADLQPARFGATVGQGVYQALQRFIVEQDAGATAARLEMSARAAYEG